MDAGRSYKHTYGPIGHLFTVAKISPQLHVGIQSAPSCAREGEMRTTEKHEHKISLNLGGTLCLKMLLEPSQSR